MVNLLLVLLMVAALGGMVFCGRGQRRRPELQLIALLLLVLVIASGGMFMCRLGALSMLGFEENREKHLELENKLREAQGYVVANFIKNSYPGNKKVLLISDAANSAFNLALLEQLRDSGVGALVQENLTLPDAAADKLITPAVDRAAEARAIEDAIAKHPDAGVVIVSGISPSGESLGRLSIYRKPENARPRLIILGVSNLVEWFADQIENGIFAAMVVTDLTKSFDSGTETVPENPLEAFNMRYVLINKDNLERNRRFFR